VEALLPRLEPLLGPAVAPPVPLDGGITNRNWRARLGEGEYVVRVCAPGVETADLLDAVFKADLAAFAGQAPRLAERYRTL